MLGISLSVNLLVLEPFPGLGYTAIAILQDMGDSQRSPEPSVITDYCIPISVQSTSFGVTRDNPSTSAHEGGASYRVNPNSGAYVFTAAIASLWDSNRNGIENMLDPCKHRWWNLSGLEPANLVGPAAGNDLRPHRLARAHTSRRRRRRWLPRPPGQLRVDRKPCPAGLQLRWGGGRLLPGRWHGPEPGPRCAGRNKLRRLPLCIRVNRGGR